jgi:LPXTG-motif cell wall-anchored protein
MRVLFRPALIGAAALIASVFPLAAQAAHAAVAPMTVHMDPTSGPVGTMVTFTPNDLCPTANGFTWEATLALTASAPDADLLASTPTSAGSWSLTYTIPDTTAVGDLTFYVECRGTVSTGAVSGDSELGAAAAGPVILAYTPVTFAVTPPATTTTASTTTTTAAVTTTTAGTTTTTAAPAMTASPTFLYQGQSCQITAHGFKPGSTVTVTVHSDPITVGTAVADSLGAITTTWNVASDFPTGKHAIVLTGPAPSGDPITLTSDVTVAALVSSVTATTVAPTTVAAGALPNTGADDESLLLTAGLLISAGTATTILTARRRRARR